MKPHEVEQGLAVMRDTLPRMWKSLYDGGLAAGFDPATALIMVQTWILSQNPHGIVPPKAATPDKPEDT